MVGHEEQYLYYGWIFRSLSRYFGYENTSNEPLNNITLEDNDIVQNNEIIDRWIYW